MATANTDPDRKPSAAIVDTAVRKELDIDQLLAAGGQGPSPIQPRAAMAPEYTETIVQTSQKLLIQESTASPDISKSLHILAPDVQQRNVKRRSQTHKVSTTSFEEDMTTIRKKVVKEILNTKGKPMRPSLLQADLFNSGPGGDSARAQPQQELPSDQSPDAKMKLLSKHEFQNKPIGPAFFKRMGAPSLTKSWSHGDLNERRQAELNSVEALARAAPREMKVIFASPSPKPKSQLQTASQTAQSLAEESTRESAAVVIQRYYRFYKMRVHFDQILSTVGHKTDHQIDPEARRQRRKSVLMWMMSKSAIKSSDRLLSDTPTAVSIKELNKNAPMGSQNFLGRNYLEPPVSASYETLKNLESPKQQLSRSDRTEDMVIVKTAQTIDEKVEEKNIGSDESLMISTSDLLMMSDGAKQLSAIVKDEPPRLPVTRQDSGSKEISVALPVQEPNPISSAEVSQPKPRFSLSNSPSSESNNQEASSSENQLDSPKLQHQTSDGNKSQELDSMSETSPGTQSPVELSPVVRRVSFPVQSQPSMSKERVLRKRINQFNMDALKGMDLLLHDACIVATPEAVADFLLHEERLSKTRIGEYLGVGEEFNIKVLHCFIHSLDFTGHDFDGAMRLLLRTFRLPGEAQKIDRVMNEFAKRYCINNPTVFSSSDTAYVLAYSLIMLNTDAHNPNVKKKMSLQDFIRNNRGIDNKQDLPKDFLENLYKNIVRNEIRMNENDNVTQIHEICSRIEGKFENIEATHRRFIRDFVAQQIPDPSKPNTHRHERVIYVFNDMIIVTKPKAYAAFASSSYNTASTFETASTTQSMTAPSGHSRDFSRVSTVTMSRGERFQYRYTFNFATLIAVDKPDTAHHANLVELINANGRLITFAFVTPDDKATFIQLIDDGVEELDDMEAEKRALLHQLTSKKVGTAKALLEQKYLVKADTNDKNAVSKALQMRFQRFQHLRKARNALEQELALLLGKPVKKNLQLPDEVYGELNVLKGDLAPFNFHVHFVIPSAAPEHPTDQPQQAQQPVTNVDELANPAASSSIKRTADEASSPGHLSPPPVNRVKRRNSIT